jgi:transposase
MPNYTHSILAVERSPPVPDRTPTTMCLCCGDTMKHFRTIAKLGVRPKQHMFVCPSCKGVDTKELNGVS